MKKIYFLFILLLATIAQNTNAQNSCSTAYQLVTGTTYAGSLVDSMPNTDTTNDYGCLTSTANATWFYFKVCTAGDFNFLINTGSSGSDIDFVAWGPLASETTCGMDSTQIVGCSISTSGSEVINITGTTSGQYYKIMMTNYSNTINTYTISQTGGSGSSCAASGCPAILPTQQICKVTTDPVANKNIIIWNKDVPFTGFYQIQKESTTMGVYTTLATVATTDTSAYTDSVSNPMIQAFKYRITTMDTCGHSNPGTYHETIHLLVSASMSTGYPQLAWNPYAGFGYGTFFIYRGTSPSTLSLYDSISSSFNTYTDVNPASGVTYYAVVVVPPTPCHPSRSLMADASFSNTAAALFTGIVENSFSDLVISPNPATSELSFSTENNHYSSINFEIYDITGRKLISNLYENTSSAKIDVSNLANGYYVVRFITDKGATQRNIIIAK
ncbi:MAG: hypothetical protein JWP12_2507 [Bacteroidetes bacterium]|nr:hypothetical protein [Bacteroidota bacterium]